MNTESPRLRALLAAGAALVVFGITIPATASPDAPNPNRPGVGEVGQAQFKADPQGQSQNHPGGDENNGFRCDDNSGAGVGNPALGACSTTPPPPAGNSDTPPAGNSDTPPAGNSDTPPPADGGGNFYVDN